MRIVKYPHPALRHKSKPLRRVDGELKNIVREMFDLMYAQNGIGLAANQVDLPYRFFILNTRGRRGQGRGVRLSQPGDQQTTRHGRGRGGLPELSRNLRPGKTGGEDRRLGL